ncbi:MAG: hypothetical protein K1X65_07275 [Caldilineales bacterium]|nr:hypothetical protein [Caldilineales bacterium]MCW5857437.1 hypothetical protein [Caldilineales bacterium]
MKQRIHHSKPHSVIVTILDEVATSEVSELALLSEAALARDWERPEEDEAWSHLAQLPSLAPVVGTSYDQ